MAGRWEFPTEILRRAYEIEDAIAKLGDLVQETYGAEGYENELIEAFYYDAYKKITPALQRSEEMRVPRY